MYVKDTVGTVKKVIIGLTCVGVAGLAVFGAKFGIDFFANAQNSQNNTNNKPQTKIELRLDDGVPSQKAAIFGQHIGVVSNDGFNTLVLGSDGKTITFKDGHICASTHSEGSAIVQHFYNLYDGNLSNNADSIEALEEHVEGCEVCNPKDEQVTGPAKEDPTGPTTGPTESTGPAEEDKDKDVVVDEKEDPTQGDGQGNGNGQGDGQGNGNGEEDSYEVIIEPKPNPLEK